LENIKIGGPVMDRKRPARQKTRLEHKVHVHFVLAILKCSNCGRLSPNTPPRLLPRDRPSLTSMEGSQSRAIRSWELISKPLP
jgi:hypothetical protein